MVPKPTRIKFEQVNVGDVFSFTTSLRPEQILQFANLTGDHNPLHTDAEFAQKTTYGKNIVHGMLAGSLFSRLIGMYCPGENSLYLSQTLEFRKPIFADDSLTVQGRITQKIESAQMVVLKTEIIARGHVAISGEARAKFIPGDHHE